MKRKDCYLSYSHKDESLARQLKQYLESQGVSVWFAPDDIPVGFSFAETIVDAIRSCDYMIVLLSENSVQSEVVLHELDFAIETANNREKRVIPILVDDVKLTNNILFYLATYQCIQVDTADPSWPEAIAPFLQDIFLSNKKSIIYEELSELIKSGLYLDASVGIADIIDIILSQLQPVVSLRHQCELIIELDQCLGKLHAFYDHCAGDYSEKAREATQHKLDLLERMGGIFVKMPEEKQDLFFVCSMIRLIYWDREIRWDCADMITHGDVSQGVVHTLPESDYAEKQSEYRDLYRQNDLSSLSEKSETVLTFVRETERFLYQSEPQSRQHPTSKTVEQNEKLEAIAGYIREGNRIFELIGNDEKAVAFIRCLITSYERLRNYCQEIGAANLTAECISRITDLKVKLQQFEDDELREHTAAERGIRALLGFSRPGLGEYDVFLSHRSNDTDIARDVYKFLKSRMKEVFFDEVSLSGELSDTDYKNAIYQALDKAKHFVVIITELKELAPGYQKQEKDWMQEEMDVFHSELIEGRKKNGNFVIIVTNDVYQQIVATNKTNIDLKWRRHSLIKLGEFQDQIIGYIKD